MNTSGISVNSLIKSLHESKVICTNALYGSSFLCTQNILISLELLYRNISSNIKEKFHFYDNNKAYRPLKCSLVWWIPPLSVKSGLLTARDIVVKVKRSAPKPLLAARRPRFNSAFPKGLYVDSAALSSILVAFYFCLNQFKKHSSKNWLFQTSLLGKRITKIWKGIFFFFIIFSLLLSRDWGIIFSKIMFHSQMIKPIYSVKNNNYYNCNDNGHREKEVPTTSPMGDVRGKRCIYNPINLFIIVLIVYFLWRGSPLLYRL